MRSTAAAVGIGSSVKTKIDTNEIIVFKKQRVMRPVGQQVNIAAGAFIPTSTVLVITIARGVLFFALGAGFFAAKQIGQNFTRDTFFDVFVVIDIVGMDRGGED